MSRFIYADNAATTQLDKDAFEAMLPWLRDEYGNASQPYTFARKPKKVLADARELIAQCIGAHPEEIYFTSGGTESDNWAIKGTALARSHEGALITSAFEHHAVMHSAEAIEMLLYPVAYMWPDKNGVIQPETLENYISDETQMVSVMMANNELGTIQPVKALCQIAHVHGALFHTDAVQAVGHIAVNVEDLGVDMLSASAHKFNGPRGVGFLYIRKGTRINPYVNGGSQEHGLRAGTENTAGIIGMAVALKKNCDVMEATTEYVLGLTKRFINALDASGLQYVQNGVEPLLPGLLSLSFAGADGEAILHRMDLMGIAISTGSACDRVNTKISHVLQAIRLDESLAKGTIRISLGKDSTNEDVDALVSALKKIIK